MRGATDDSSIKVMADNDSMAPGTIYVDAATLSGDSYHRIAASGGVADALGMGQAPGDPRVDDARQPLHGTDYVGD